MKNLLPTSALCLLALLMVQADLSAQSFYDGSYLRGTYRVDRWGQHRFGNLFVSPKLHVTLKPYLGKLISIEVKRAHQPMIPGGAMVMEVGKIEKLPEPVEITISRIPANAPSVVQPRKPIILKIAVTNRMDKPLQLERGSVSLYAEVYYPSVTKIEGWPYAGEGYRPDSVVGDRHSYHRAFMNLALRNQEVEEPETWLSRQPWPAIKEPVILEPGKSHSWTVYIHRFMPNEYELFSVFAHESSDPKKYPKNHLYVHSNALRIDTHADTPVSNEGLEIRVKRDGAMPIRAGKPISLRVEFKNKGVKRLELFGDRRGRRSDSSRYLMCYDKEGNLIHLLPLKREERGLSLRIAPGATETVSVQAPAGTRLARIVFGGLGYSLSPHLLIDAP